jgi:ABC-type Mn2+/Zn2+ transport system ATPase subunit
MSQASRSESRPLISIRDGCFGYRGRREVLRGVELDVSAGEFWCFLGPNGEGKTTLVKALLGALPPRRGQVVRQLGMFRAGKVSYVPQRLELSPTLPMTVREFVLTGLAGIRADRDSSQRRLDHILQLVGLIRLARQSIWTLSGGQRQRTLVARALIRDPSLLIVDEPTTGLDAASSTAVVQILNQLYTQFRVSIVMVTHDLELAARLATHVAFFRQGRVTAGPVGELLTSEQLQHTFGLQASVRCDETGRRHLDIEETSLEPAAPLDLTASAEPPPGSES